MDWPKYFPDRCPPADAGTPDGIVYRFVRNNPPVDADFVSVHLERPNEDFGDELCEACGLSVYTVREDALRAWKRVPGMRKRHIAEGSLHGVQGRFKPTPRGNTPSHSTWWIPDGVNPPCVRFKVVVLAKGHQP